MKKVILLVFAAVFALHGFGQNRKKKNDGNASAYRFTVVKDNAATSTKDQCMTGTCWSFATVSFIESELLRMGKGEHDLSEMFNVRMTYPKKAEMYVRYQGKAQFGPGSLSHDVINAIRDYGMVPDSVYSGLNPGVEEHNHGAMDAMLKGVVDGVVNARGEKSGAYQDAVEAILDASIGEAPETFQYKGRKVTPAQFRDALGFNPDDYVSLTSFSHHEFYEPFILEVPDNFSQGSFYNVPIDELNIAVMDAVRNGYTVAWDADVSERGFSFRNGMAIMAPASTPKTDLFKKYVQEIVTTQESRQAAFDAQATTDDHLMHITGLSKDNNGVNYYITKNSWGTENDYKGFQHVSEEYFKMKTVGVMMHKDALPTELRLRLGL